MAWLLGTSWGRTILAVLAGLAALTALRTYDRRQGALNERARINEETRKSRERARATQEEIENEVYRLDDGALRDRLSRWVR